MWGTSRAKHPGRRLGAFVVVCVGALLLMAQGAQAQTAAITVAQTASASTLPAPGGTFAATVTVENVSGVPVTVTGLRDDVYGDLSGQGTCVTGALLAPAGGSYSCSFDATISGSEGTSLTHVVTAAAVTDGGSVVVGSVAATVSVGTLPPPGAKFAFHDHETTGRKWHVELRIAAQDRNRIQTLVVYSEQCKATIAEQAVAISDAGVVSAGGPLKGGGRWEVKAAFTAPTTLLGTMRMSRPDCDTGELSFPSAITGDGHADHAHAGAGHGQPYPDFGAASPAQRAQARALRFQVLKRWRTVTRADARRLGFVRRGRGHVLRARLFHLYNNSYENDGRSFDPARPESLVFWRGHSGEPMLVGLMFRVPPGPRPSFAGPIPLYHSHATTDPSSVPSMMTHVWMVTGNRSAWAGCLPVAQLEQYNPAFKWVPDRPREHVGAPCPSS